MRHQTPSDKIFFCADLVIFDLMLQVKLQVIDEIAQFLELVSLGLICFWWESYESSEMVEAV
jgi:hypothetical protein